MTAADRRAGFVQTLAVGLGLCVCLAAGASANDSVINISTGGIVLEKTPHVRILEEDLRVSPDRIEVRYVFENTSNRDQALTMGFPFPDVFVDDVDHRWADRPPLRRFAVFETTVDGRPVDAEEIVEVIGLDGRNLTGLFRKEGLPLVPYAPAYVDTWTDPEDGDAMALKEKLRGLGLLGNFESRKWKFRVNYVWRHVFKAGGRTAVRHVYRPIAGAFVFTPQVASPGADKSFAQWFRDAFCPSDATWAEMLKLTEHQGAPTVRQVGYVLRTATSWAGPIGDFRLTVDKGRAGNALATCWRGPLTPSGPTAFTFSARDFAPDQDLSIAILQAAPPGERP
mgnify:CR=1 FL=1